MQDKVVDFIQGCCVEHISYTEGIGLRVHLSGGTDKTGIFFSKLQIQGTSEQFSIARQKDLAVVDPSLFKSARVTSAVVTTAGDLFIKLDNGYALFFPPQKGAQAWELRWHGGKQITGRSGNGLSEA